MKPGQVMIIPGDRLEPWEYDHLAEFLQIVVAKIEKARAAYGMDYLMRSDESFRQNLIEEWADCIGWPAMAFIKQARAKEQKEEPRHESSPL